MAPKLAAQAPKQSEPLKSSEEGSFYGSVSAAAADPQKFFRDTTRWLENADETDPAQCITWFCEDYRPRKLKAPLALAWLAIQIVAVFFQFALYSEVSTHLETYEVALATYCGPEHWRGDVCLGPMWNMSFSNTITFPPIPDTSTNSDFDFVIPSDETYTFQSSSQPPTFLVGIEPLAPHADARWQSGVASRSGWTSNDKYMLGSSWRPLKASGTKYAVLSFKDYKAPGLEHECAHENAEGTAICDCPAGRVKYGHHGDKDHPDEVHWTDWRPVEESVLCSNKVFGDDFPHVGKVCVCQPGEFQCAAEGFGCSCEGEVKYGHADTSGHESHDHGSVWSPWRPASGLTDCSNDVFGDVCPHHPKVCRCRGKTGPNAWTGSISLKSSYMEDAQIHVFVVDARIEHLEDIHQQKQCSFEDSWANFNQRHSGQHHQILSYTQSATFFFLMVALATTGVVIHRFYFYVESGKLLSRIIAVKFLMQDFPQQMCIVAYLYGWYARDGLRCQMCLFHPAHCDDEYPLHWNNLMVCIFTLLSACSNQMLMKAKNKKYDEDDLCMLFLARSAIFSMSVLPFSTAFLFLSYTLLNIRSVLGIILSGVTTLIGWWSIIAMPMFWLCEDE